MGWIVAYEEVYEGRTAAHRRRGARAGEEEQEEGDEVDEAHWFDFLDRDSKMTRKFKTYTRYSFIKDTILMKKGGRLL